MKRYDAQIEAERKRKEQLATTPDEDGFVLVTKRGRRPASDGHISMGVASAAEAEEAAKKHKIKTLDGFYNFQKVQVQKESMLRLCVVLPCINVGICRNCGVTSQVCPG